MTSPSPNPLRKLPRPVQVVLALVVLCVAGYFGVDLTGHGASTARPPAQGRPSSGSPGATRASDTQPDADARALIDAMRAQRSGLMLSITAPVLKALSDDNDGARHQRFLLAIEVDGAPYDTLLVAHNIDLSRRVPLHKGDTVTVRGQYEWNEKGGVLHWTHHDPGQRREGGWILHDGTTYE